MISATTARKELRNLSKKRAEHNREIAAIDELESALNVILGHADRGSGNTGKRSGKKGAAKPALAKVAFDVLRKEKTPLHINDLWAKIEAAICGLRSKRRAWSRTQKTRLPCFRLCWHATAARVRTSGSRKRSEQHGR